MNKRNQRSNRKPNQKIHRQRNTNTKAKSKRETNYSESIQLVEGRHAVREAILAGTRKVREVNMSEGLDPGSVIEDITNLSKELKIPLRMHAKSKFKSITITESAQGVQAVCDPLPDLEIEDLVEGTENPFILVLDSITDPRNLGSIIRSAVSFNIDGLHHYDIGVLLDKMGIAIRTGHHCTQPIMEKYNILGTARVSLSVYNTIDEIDCFISAIQRIKNMLS